MRQFLSKSLLFSSVLIIAFIMLLVMYFIYDPYKVIKKYNDYSYKHIITNRDFISTETFLNKYKKYLYNSFIFGSSRTLALKPSSWQKYLATDDNPFMFDASSESIYGIYSKLKLLDSLNISIDNAIILICRDESFNLACNSKGHLFIKHPAISGESKLKFHVEFIKAYFNKKFLLNYYAFKLLGGYKSFMSGVIDKRTITFDTVTNEMRIIDQEAEISQNPDEYYSKRQNLFYTRQDEQIDSVSRINNKHLFMLKEIKKILEKHNTNYKVVISPLYEQVKLSKEDNNILNNLYGKNLYDFSGKNSFTESIYNFYETSHYRPNVGDSIMRIIYN